jgi:hypothetical protein
MFPRSAFHDALNNTTTQQEDEKYRQCFIYWLKLKHLGKVKTRWDYLKFYNISDCRIMRPAIDNLIKNMWEDKVDMVKGFSLAQNASSAKFTMAWSDFKMDGNYAVDDASVADFELTEYHWKKMCSGYRKQDKLKNRDIKNNVNAEDYTDIKKMFKKPCYICGKRFTSILHPTLDRKDNFQPHTLENVVQCCELCNKSRSNRSAEETKLQIQVRQYAFKYNLPMTIDNEAVHDLIRNGITGGLSNVMHRINIGGETKINKFHYKDGKVISKDTENTMTHAIGVDFNSLYPFCYGSIKTP